jgi:hypothetical protein
MVMSYYQTQFAHTSFQSSADADLLLRIGIALAARQRAAWRVVRVAAQNGVVRLEGVVPTFYDRQLILSVARHIAGVLRVEDELAIDEPTSRRQESKAVESSAPADNDVAESKAAPAPNAFHHLPELTPSLDEILAARTLGVSAAG